MCLAVSSVLYSNAGKEGLCSSRRRATAISHRSKVPRRASHAYINALRTSGSYQPYHSDSFKTVCQKTMALHVLGKRNQVPMKDIEATATMPRFDHRRSNIRATTVGPK